MDGWRDFNPVPRPKGMRKRADKACFLNALRVVLRDDTTYSYAEGLAWTKLGAVHHAWVVDSDGNAIDPTWKEPASGYYGVVFPLSAIKVAGWPTIDDSTITEAYGPS